MRHLVVNFIDSFAEVSHAAFYHSSRAIKLSDKFHRARITLLHQLAFFLFNASN